MNHLLPTLGNVHNLPREQKQKWNDNNKNATEEQNGEREQVS